MKTESPTLAEILANEYTKPEKTYPRGFNENRCYECGSVLSDDDKELGYECESCRRHWMAEVTGDGNYL